MTGPPDKEREYSEDGVDLTLIRWMLSLTVTERLEVLQAMADLVYAARETSGLPSDPAHSR